MKLNNTNFNSNVRLLQPQRAVGSRQWTGVTRQNQNCYLRSNNEAKKNLRALRGIQFLFCLLPTAFRGWSFYATANPGLAIDRNWAIRTMHWKSV